MASIIIFSTLWGIALKEWKGAGPRTKLLVALSLLVLVGLHGDCGLWQLHKVKAVRQRNPPLHAELGPP